MSGSGGSGEALEVCLEAGDDAGVPGDLGAPAACALPADQPQPLFRLRYADSAHSFGFALYSHATERYEDAVLLNGSPTGTPQEALDTACTLYLAGTGHEPQS